MGGRGGRGRGGGRGDERGCSTSDSRIEGDSFNGLEKTKTLLTENITSPPTPFFVNSSMNN